MDGFETEARAEKNATDPSGPGPFRPCPPATFVFGELWNFRASALRNCAFRGVSLYFAGCVAAIIPALLAHQCTCTSSQSRMAMPACAPAKICICLWGRRKSVQATR